LYNTPKDNFGMVSAFTVKWFDMLHYGFIHLF